MATAKPLTDNERRLLETIKALGGNPTHAEVQANLEGAGGMSLWAIVKNAARLRARRLLEKDDGTYHYTLKGHQ